MLHSPIAKRVHAFAKTPLHAVVGGSFFANAASLTQEASISPQINETSP